ncbi:hypothetical protein [Polyangium sp. 15x6]|uniref:dipeptidyl-peptidase 3 family protein n=1 Tax=Polyangium sp. 15x6 TaxID=3042687 RepID=UPI00249C5BBA|nr:hypothetical protein [Polyangium sp. 15x6]MDI3289818.1 hypothetical protein [Polyangium sp. 15x6]
MHILPDVSARLARFVPTPIDADLDALAPDEREVLLHLVRASLPIDAIFLRQSFAKAPEMRAELTKESSPLAKDALSYFDLSAGPWDRLDQEPFVGGMLRPPGAGYYPVDMTKDEFEAWIAAHPAEADALRSLYTLVRRGEKGLVTIPYSTAFRSLLEPVVAELGKAAAATKDAGLARYLGAVVKALGADEYYESDLAWMDMESRVEVTIGPYETYEDRLFGYKAAFTSFVTVIDPSASSTLARLKSELPAMEQNLPIPDEHKNPNRGTDSPIRVADLVYSAGDTRAGVQTLAFNLPNDERVREAKGSKNVLLRNVMKAKFEGILKPIAARVLAAEELARLSADAFFHHTLLHELSHGLGPGRIVVDGTKAEVRLRLEELHSPFEEAKADVMGIYNILFLMDRGVLAAEGRSALFSTFLAGMFRATRFGIEEAHGKGTALQLHWLMEKGVIREDTSSGPFSIDHEKMPGAIRALLGEILLVQARGDKEGARAMLSKYGVMSEPLARALGKLGDIPVDIRPIYPAAERLLGVTS